MRLIEASDTNFLTLTLLTNLFLPKLFVFAGPVHNNPKAAHSMQLQLVSKSPKHQIRSGMGFAEVSVRLGSNRV